jgi:hypothetical protein
MKLSLKLAIIATFFGLADPGMGDVPFAVPQGYLVLSEAEANEEFDNSSLFSAGGFALRNEAGTLIYHVGNDVPVLQDQERREEEFFDLFRDAEKLLPEPRYEIREKSKLTIGSRTWNWIVGTAPHDGERRAFVVAETDSKYGTFDLWGVSVPAELRSLEKAMVEIITQLSAPASNK